ncbi:alpha/beta hydrolase [Pseudomonas uvaldensis]|uniref:alpha/beta hydrolase n=1 Tax=Pseudomonas uvaldensis TaxID=2878385 RepID=UPI001E5B86B8|nr:alpha/beta hydrolase [Pseudomonas uvaldensis]MCE0464170.1 alpha/beta hydrolase [Pseudomonas uvaldensis]
MKPEELLDPAFHSFMSPSPERWSLDTLPAIRTRVHSAFKPAHRVRCTESWIPGTDGERLRLCFYRPTNCVSRAPPPTILYVHGGGFVLGRPEMADDYLADLADELQVPIVAVDYRLAPEYAFPAPLEDCYTALGWMHVNALSLNLDPQRIVVMGHSAGGGLAAALAIMARDRQQYPVAAQVLIYPMLDHRTGSSDSLYLNPSTGTFNWLPAQNQFCWECLRGGYRLDDGRVGWFSPALEQALGGLPPCFLSVGALDLFVDEDVAYAMGLSQAGVGVELHVYPGAPHMFDQVPGRITTQLAIDVVRALRQFLG